MCRVSEDMKHDLAGLCFPRVWAWPSINTFDIIPILNLLKDEGVGKGWVDPFSGWSKLAEWTNDIAEGTPATCHMDALEYLQGLQGIPIGVDGVVLDPPYSPEQARRKYKAKFEGIAGLMEYLAKCKDEIARIIRPGGRAICFGWNSSGIGSIRGFKLVRGLLVCHGQRHDTIVTVEVKQ